MDEGISRGLGRIELQLDQVLHNQREQGQMLAKHDVRLDRVESDVKDLQTANTADDRHGMSFRSSLTVALISVTSSGALAYVVSLINSR